jgi:hypothetical protein
MHFGRRALGDLYVSLLEFQLCMRWLKIGVDIFQAIDLDGLTRTGRFVFVDGLSGLFLDDGVVDPNIPRQRGRRTVEGAALDSVKKELHGAVEDLQSEGARIFLIIDQLDFFLAASGEDVTGAVLANMSLDIREVCYCITLHRITQQG